MKQSLVPVQDHFPSLLSDNRSTSAISAWINFCTVQLKMCENSLWNFMFTKGNILLLYKSESFDVLMDRLFHKNRFFLTIV